MPTGISDSQKYCSPEAGLIEHRGHGYHGSIDSPAARHQDFLFASQGRNYPRHAMRVVSKVLSNLHAEPTSGASKTWGRLRHLTLTNFEVEPEEWDLDMRAIKASMTSFGEQEVIIHPVASSWLIGLRPSVTCFLGFCAGCGLL
jgi:hypothetical protein